MINNKAVAVVAALGAFAANLCGSPAKADTAASTGTNNAANSGMYATATSNDWHFEITPYVWTPGMSGTVTVHGHPFPVDETFSDIFKIVKFALSGLAIAEYRQWLVWTQADYMYLNTDKLNEPPARGNLNSKLFLWTVGGGYRFPLWADGQTLDVLVGEQGADMKNTLTAYNIGSIEQTRDVIDTVLILRPSFQLTKQLRFNPTMSYGGGDSDVTYQLQPQLQYQFTDRLEARLGYRKLHYKINSDRNNVLDLNLAGPFVGFGWTF